MKKHVFLEIILALVIVGVSYWNVSQQNDLVAYKEVILRLKEDQEELQRNEETLIYENERLTDRAAAATKAWKELQQSINQSGTDVDMNGEFVSVVTKLFEANLNFTPETYGKRKQEVSAYLSEELNKEYFGQKRKTYQDANGTTSRLDSLDVYAKAVQGNVLEGLAMVTHSSKQSGQEWTTGMNIFKVTYDTKMKKVTEIENLGSGYVGGQNE